MKELLKRHWDKIFLVLMVVVCGLSLVASLSSLGRPSVLTPKQQAAKDHILEKLRHASPKRIPVAPYQDMLAANLAGCGRFEKLAAEMPARLVYAAPLGEYVKPRYTVDGIIGRPTGVSASADRARATVTWSPGRTEHVKVSRFELVRKKKGGDWTEEPVGSTGGGETTYVDGSLEPETAYSYKVRVVGRALPPKQTTVIPPGNVKVDAGSGEWTTGWSGEASATTPSNVDFECNSMYEEIALRANLKVKRWNAAAGGWDEFNTRGGVGEGDAIVGWRMEDTYRLVKFESGYVLKRIEAAVEIITEGKWVLRMVDGKIKRVWVENTREMPIHKLFIDKADGSRKLMLKYWSTMPDKEKGAIELDEEGTPKSEQPKAAGEVKVTEPGAAKTPKPPAPKPKPPSGGGDILDQLKAKMKGTAGSKSAPKAPPAGSSTTGAPATGPAAPAGLKRVTGRKSALSVLVPKGGSDEPLELDHLIKLRTTLNSVGYAMVGGSKGGTEGSGVVLGDKALPDAELEKLMGRSAEDITKGLAAEEAALLFAEALKKQGLKKMRGSVVKEEVRALSTDSGRPVAAFALTVKDIGQTLVIVRYCAPAGSHLYILTAVVREGDHGSQKAALDKVARSMAW